MNDALFLFGGAFVIGLSGAMMPGPVLTAVVGESLRTGWRAGPLIVLGHALVELAILAVVVAGISGPLRIPWVQGLLGIAGGGMLLALGANTIRTAGAAARAAAAADPGATPPRRRHPVLLGAALSLANPNWILWWATIGLHYASLALRLGGAGLASFYAGHVSSDLVWYSLVSAAVAAGRRVCSTRSHARLLRGCGLALLALGAHFLGGGIGTLAGP